MKKYMSMKPHNGHLSGVRILRKAASKKWDLF